MFQKSVSFSINNEERCDGATDCLLDSSDEFDCERVALSKGYLKYSPPKSAYSDTLKLLTDVRITNILDLNEINSKMTLQVRYDMCRNSLQ